tara:strand:- start:443 stop:1234 length:792 start_codon:yes stop_codon:yes gene_type:complete
MHDPLTEPDIFETAFDAMLAGDDGALDAWLPDTRSARPGLAVYRNTVAKARVDALAGLFPTVERLVGTDWFRQAALTFAGSAPPTSAILDDYGLAFPDWLTAFPPAQDLPYLAPVARLDLAWSQSHRAPNARSLSSRDTAHLPPARLFTARAGLHPSARLFWFDRTVPTIWIANRIDGETHDAVWEERPEGLLIVRPAGAVTWHRLSHPQWTFLKACRQGNTLGQAAQDAFATSPALDLGALFASLLTMGALSPLQPETLPHD